MALKATVRTLRENVRFRRPCLPHFGQGAFLGARQTGITTGVGVPVPMLASFDEEAVFANLDHKDASPIFQEQNGLRQAHPPVVFGEKSQNFKQIRSTMPVKRNFDGGLGRPFELLRAAGRCTN